MRIIIQNNTEQLVSHDMATGHDITNLATKLATVPDIPI